MSHLKHPWIFMATWFVHFNKAAWVCASQHGRDLCLSRMLGVTAGRSGNRINWTHVTWAYCRYTINIEQYCNCCLWMYIDVRKWTAYFTVSSKAQSLCQYLKLSCLYVLILFSTSWCLSNPTHPNVTFRPAKCPWHAWYVTLFMTNPAVTWQFLLLRSPCQIGFENMAQQCPSATVGNAGCQVSGCADHHLVLRSSKVKHGSNRHYSRQETWAPMNLCFFWLIFAYFSLRSWSTNVLNFRQRCLWCLLFSISSSTCAINWAICLPWSHASSMHAPTIQALAKPCLSMPGTHEICWVHVGFPVAQYFLIFIDQRWSKHLLLTMINKHMIRSESPASQSSATSDQPPCKLPVESPIGRATSL